MLLPVTRLLALLLLQQLAQHFVLLLQELLLLIDLIESVERHGPLVGLSVFRLGIVGFAGFAWLGSHIFGGVGRLVAGLSTGTIVAIGYGRLVGLEEIATILAQFLVAAVIKGVLVQFFRLVVHGFLLVV